MPRRARTIKRKRLPDARYHNDAIARFINKVMNRGKKSVAVGIVYDALAIVEKELKNPADVFDQALKNVPPVLEVKPRRVGGATYQVPVDIRPDRRLALGMRWLLQAARSRKGKPMANKLADGVKVGFRGRG